MAGDSELDTGHSSPDEALPARHERFCQEYIKDLNGAAAYSRAGFKTKSPDVAAAAASRLLTDVKVSKRVKILKKQQAEQNSIEAGDIIQELMLLGFSDVSRYLVDPKTGEVLPPPDHPSAMRAVSSIKRRFRLVDGQVREVQVEIRLWSKIEALKSLGEHLGVFDQRGGEDGKAPFKVYLGFDPREALLQAPDGDGK